MAKPRIPPVLKRAIANTFRKPATAKYPYVQPKLDGNFRGQPVFDVDRCIGCGICSRDCPARAIEMHVVEGKKRPQFHLERCIFCYQCSESCPKKAIKKSTCYALATTDKADLTIEPQTCTIPEERKNSMA